MNLEVANDPSARGEIITALTGPLDGLAEKATTLAQKIERASRDLDRRVAFECARVLGDCVFQERPRARDLEALVILGLAHPRVFRKLGLSISSEGRRLGLLLESEGRPKRARELLELLSRRNPEDREVQQDLASLMRRTGGVQVFIRRCMQKAEAEAKAGRFMESISCLQEVLLHDQGRRDVARMIRDLRHEDLRTRQRRRFLGRAISLSCLLSVLAAAVGIRELTIRQSLAEIHPALHDDVASLRGRMAALGELQSRHVFWFGYFEAVNERSRLQRQIDALEARAAEKERERIQKIEQRAAMAESARAKGLLAFEGGDLPEALQQFRAALELGTEGWAHRERLLVDVEAIESWLEGHRK